MLVDRESSILPSFESRTSPIDCRTTNERKHARTAARTSHSDPFDRLFVISKSEDSSQSTTMMWFFLDAANL